MDDVLDFVKARNNKIAKENGDTTPDESGVELEINDCQEYLEKTLSHQDYVGFLKVLEMLRTIGDHGVVDINTIRIAITCESQMDYQIFDTNDENNPLFRDSSVKQTTSFDFDFDDSVSTEDDYDIFLQEGARNVKQSLGTLCDWGKMEGNFGDIDDEELLYLMNENLDDLIDDEDD